MNKLNMLCNVHAYKWHRFWSVVHFTTVRPKTYLLVKTDVSMLVHLCTHPCGKVSPWSCWTCEG